jgi:hypothetical protein
MNARHRAVERDVAGIGTMSTPQSGGFGVGPARVR